LDPCYKGTVLPWDESELIVNGSTKQAVWVTMPVNVARTTCCQYFITDKADRVPSDTRCLEDPSKSAPWFNETQVERIAI
jgi:hypothetical protein